MGQYCGSQNEESSSTQLATPKKEQESKGEETLLVTETFHLSQTKEDVLHRTKICRHGKKSYFLIAGISMIILLGIVIFFRYPKDTHISAHSENNPDKVQQVTSKAGKEGDAIQAVVGEIEVRKVTVNNHAKDESILKDTLVHVVDKSSNKDVSGSSLPVVSVTKSEVQDKRHKVSSPEKSTALPSSFLYGMKNRSRPTSRGTVEANLRSSRYRSNYSFSYGASKANRVRRRNNATLRFEIKDSGTRSVK